MGEARRRAEAQAAGLPVPPRRRAVTVSESLMARVETVHQGVCVVARRQGFPVPSSDAFLDGLIRSALDGFPDAAHRLVVTPDQAPRPSTMPERPHLRSPLVL